MTKPPEGLHDDRKRALEGLLATLPADLRAELEELAVFRIVPEGCSVVEEGGSFTTVGYILSGALGMEKSLPDGRLHVIGLLVPHDMFGRLFDGPSSYDLVALAPARLIEFERNAFEDFVTRHPEAQNLLLTRILDELDTAREWLLLMSGHKVVERVAALLLVLFRRNLRHRPVERDDAGHVIVDLPIRRPALARYLGTRPETLSRAMHELQRKGSVQLLGPNRVTVLSVQRLVRAAGSDLLIGGET
jgi:CRP/FNR family transcriptional regulator